MKQRRKQGAAATAAAPFVSHLESLTTPAVEVRAVGPKNPRWRIVRAGHDRPSYLVFRGKCVAWIWGAKNVAKVRRLIRG